MVNIDIEEITKLGFNAIKLIMKKHNVSFEIARLVVAYYLLLIDCKNHLPLEKLDVYEKILGDII